MAEYIEREAALRALCEAVHAKDGNIPCRNQLVSCLWAGTRTQEYAEKILAIPAADVAPIKHAKWIDKSSKKLLFGRVLRDRIVQCDQCRNYLDMDGVNGGRGDANYCPNCGARMEVCEEET